ncbi:uncharacterized protein LOC124115035 [Haliotis rufescens]|uniref:uncharacterized protein LOC124115035 n=1 Tax=Haliotis rufescens TaxID=6454 RepID=UPI00201E9155|nr:uncharacterized protein LOC124115035 [Haliotis rufescens]
MLSFIYPKYDDGNPILLISAEDRAYVTITIPLLSQRLTKDIAPGETWKPHLPTELRYTDYFTTVASAVNVTSTSPVTVYVYDGYKRRSSGYMALPLHALSTSYVAVTYSGEIESAYPVLLLVAIMDDTAVDVLYRLSSGECDERTTGESSRHTLQAYDVYGLRCTGDFTGTYVVSNKPFVVISGHENTQISGNYKDTVQEMLIPVDQFGLSYVLISHYGSSRGTIARIVSSSDNTQVVSSTGATFPLNAYDYVDIDTDESGQQCIHSNYPVLVVSFGKSKIGGSDKLNFDAAMYLVPATNMFTTSIYIDYGLAAELHINESVSIAIVFHREDTPDFSTFTTVHEVISSCPYHVYTMTVTAWPVAISGGSVKFGAYLYGSNVVRHNGVAFPLNMAFASGLVSTSLSSLLTTESSTRQPSFLSQVPDLTSPIDGIQPSSLSQFSELTSTTDGIQPSSVSQVPELTSITDEFHPSSLSQFLDLTSPTDGIQPSSLSQFLDLISLTDGMQSFSNLIGDNEFTSSMFHSMTSHTHSKRTSSASMNIQPTGTQQQSSIPDMPLTSAVQVSPLPYSTSHSSFETHSPSTLLPVTRTDETSTSASEQGCVCLCKVQAPWNITEKLIKKVREGIKDLLLLDTTKLSKTIRKRTSAHDNRPCAVTLGSVGITFLLLTVVVIFVPDVMSALRFICTEARDRPKVLQFVRNVK